MKILMLGWEFPPLLSGGLGIATYGLVKALSPKVQIRLILPNAAGGTDIDNVHITGLNRLTIKELDLERLLFSLSSLGVDVTRIPITLSPYHHTNHDIEQSELNALNALRQAKGTSDDIREIFSSDNVYGMNIMQKVFLFAWLAEELGADGNYDLIHAHDWITYPAAVQLKRRTGKPLLLHVHALETDRAGEGVRNGIYDLEKTALEAADHVVAVSHYTKGQIIQHYQIHPDKISVVHNGIDPVKTKRTTHKLKDKLVIFLGRLTHQKGPQFLLETAEKLCRVYPRVKFVVAGTGDQFIHSLESAAYKKLGSKFIFTGFLSKGKVNELLALADVYFMPSVSEPFGLTALEAVQHSVPSVLSAQSGASEVIYNALKADSWDTDKYANYIYALLKYDTLAKEITSKAMQELDLLTWDQASNKILQIYNKISHN